MLDGLFLEIEHARRSEEVGGLMSLKESGESREFRGRGYMLCIPCKVFYGYIYI